MGLLSPTSLQLTAVLIQVGTMLNGQSRQTIQSTKSSDLQEMLQDLVSLTRFSCMVSRQLMTQPKHSTARQSLSSREQKLLWVALSNIKELSLQLLFRFLQDTEELREEIQLLSRVQTSQALSLTTQLSSTKFLALLRLLPQLQSLAQRDPDQASLPHPWASTYLAKDTSRSRACVLATSTCGQAIKLGAENLLRLRETQFMSPKDWIFSLMLIQLLCSTQLLLKEL